MHFIPLPQWIGSKCGHKAPKSTTSWTKGNDVHTQIWFFARPLVLDAARVKENCFSLSFILAPSCQSLAEGGNRQVLPVFWRFCPIAKAVGGRQRDSGANRAEEAWRK